MTKRLNETNKDLDRWEEKYTRVLWGTSMSLIC